ncbi:MAG: cysteinyl-tRNA synthetase [Planctomycetota bacterium]|jgi:cysteinyl-tRNA synthetase
MSIQIHDSLTRELRPFTPLIEGQVRMYVCGPTVYDDAHVGHLMGPVVFDTVARWLRARGYAVQFVNNITDIDDKIIRRAEATGEAWDSISQRYTVAYKEHLADLGIDTITDFPHCTEYVTGMVDFIQKLIDAGKAYEAPDGVYFEVGIHPGYGKLSGRKLEDMRSGTRVAASEGLKDASDFALWKKAKPGEPSWPSPWGDGRPGWHIECSVMSSELLGGDFDIHGGGDDLKFPHHENEIAQSEAHGDNYATTWMHNGLVQYGGRKIAKSDERMQDAAFRQQFQAPWLLENHGPPAVRYFLMRSPYRSPVDFEPGALASAATGLKRMYRLLGERLEAPTMVGLEQLLALELPEAIAKQREAFCRAMDADFNTGEAVGALFSMLSEAKSLPEDQAEQAFDLVRDLGRLIGLLMPGDAAKVAGAGSSDARLQALLPALAELRAGARERKDWTTADGLRDALGPLGIKLQDGPEGTTAEVESPAADDLVSQALTAVLVVRDEARARKDFTTSDAIRDKLAGAGVSVLDGADGSAWQFS